MNVSKETRTPIKLRISASIVGGIIGALNPAMFVFYPSYIEKIQSRFHFNYPDYAMKTLGISLFLLFIPCTLSTFSLYPWLYKRLSKFITERKIPSLSSYIQLGTVFGCMATFATAFFFVVGVITVNFLNSKPMGIGEIIALLFGGTLYIYVIGLFYLPMIIITGSFFTCVNYFVIKREK
jgi:threonine/homoserine/homoserine lactone efflux protein